jgi:hypothetical protein
MSKVIIGVHGLGNKPPHRVLQASWKHAICEGLKAAGLPEIPFQFKLVYWANLIYPEPLDPGERDETSSRYDDEPYVPATNFVKREASKLRKKVLDYLSKQLEVLFLNEDLSINFSSITDLIIQRYFKELDLYYCKSCVMSEQSGALVRHVIREQLTKMLEHYKGNEVLLISHSMGSIIAYDVLIMCSPDITIDTFVTIGSPLGIPVVLSKIASDQKASLEKDFKARVPETITGNWFNFSDLEDNMTVNYRLCDDFAENSRHVRVIDKIVYNNYEYQGNQNPHKSYGYLRTPELAEVIYAFQTRHEEGEPTKNHDNNVLTT